VSEKILSELQITDDVWTALLERHGLGVFENVAPLNSDQSTVLINKRFVVRINQRQPELPVVAWEAAIYRRLRRATDVPCPDVLALDLKRDLIPFDLLILSHIPGEIGSKIWPRLDTNTHEHISEELGRLSASVHGLRWPIYGEFVSLGSQFTQSVRWPDIVNRKIVELYQLCDQKGILPLPLLDMLITTLNDGDALYETASLPTLAHTKLDLSNVLLQQNGSRWHVGAILEWKAAFVVDAAWEFASMWRDPSRVYPDSGSFMYGYKERYPPQDDLRVRLQLYRLLQLFEAIVTARPDAPHGTDRTEAMLRTLRRQLHIS
jgi:aminoglycoside phosphotransferase (APT) family kinase protein